MPPQQPPQALHDLSARPQGTTPLHHTEALEEDGSETGRYYTELVVSLLRFLLPTKLAHIALLFVIFSSIKHVRCDQVCCEYLTNKEKCTTEQHSKSHLLSRI